MPSLFVMRFFFSCYLSIESCALMGPMKNYILYIYVPLVLLGKNITLKKLTGKKF